MEFALHLQGLLGRVFFHRYIASFSQLGAASLRVGDMYLVHRLLVASPEWNH